MKRQDLEQMTKQQQIEYYTNMSNLINVSNGNAKTGMACLTLSMPTICCKPDAPCRKDCYCMRGHQGCPSVVGSYFRNYRIWNEDHKNFEEQVEYHLKFSGLKLFRYNDAGEIPDVDYLDMIFRLAVKYPDVKFLCYTKKYELVNRYIADGHRPPENLCIRFSAWNKEWEVFNPYNLPMAYVDFKDKANNPEIPLNAFNCDCKTTCSVCQMCWNKNVKSVKFHQH